MIGYIIDPTLSKSVRLSRIGNLFGEVETPFWSQLYDEVVRRARERHGKGAPLPPREADVLVKDLPANAHPLAIGLRSITRPPHPDHVESFLVKLSKLRREQGYFASVKLQTVLDDGSAASLGVTDTVLAGTHAVST